MHHWGVVQACDDKSNLKYELRERDAVGVEGWRVQPGAGSPEDTFLSFGVREFWQAR